MDSIFQITTDSGAVCLVPTSQQKPLWGACGIVGEEGALDAGGGGGAAAASGEGGGRAGLIHTL